MKRLEKQLNWLTVEGRTSCLSGIKNPHVDSVAVIKALLGRTRASSIIVSAVVALFTCVSRASDLAVSAELEPAEIELGNSAQLTVTINGPQGGVPNPPSVPGLSFDHVGESSRYQVINGVMSASVTHTYAVTPNQSGTFSIPKIEVNDGQNRAESRSFVLKVLNRAGGGTAANGGAGGQRLPAPTVNDSDNSLPTVGRNEIGFLRIVTPKKEFYVGEMVPVELKAYFRTGVELRVDGLPQLNSDAFTMNKLGSQPIRSQELVNRESFTVFTWPTAVTAVKAGDYNLTVEIPATVTVRQRAARPHSRSPFGDSFFDDAFSDSLFDQFFGSATQKEIKLGSGEVNAKILSLPAENRPASFAGAVGKFDIAASASPTRAGAGDPITLKLNVTGCGNFDRVTAPWPDSVDGWKAYKPRAHFDAEDSAGFQGVKAIETALVPQRSGDLEIPALEFSFFDPKQRAYVTRTTAPVKVTVASAGIDGPPTASSKSVPVASPEAAPFLAVNSEQSTQQTVPAASASSPHPWLGKLWGLCGVLVPIPLAAGAVALARRRKKRANDPAIARSLAIQRAGRERLATMESAVARGESLEFFNAARAAFQQRLGSRWGLRPETITLAEINVRLNGKADGMRPVFEMADEVTYTGRTFTEAQLQLWIQVVNNELKKLENI